MGIASLDTSGPTSSNLLSTGAADIRALRTAIRESFVNFGIGTDVVTATAAQINGAPNKAGAETISGAWVFTAPVTVPLGSPSAPSVAFAGDSNTGMYSEGSNVINFATEGVERLSITGSEVAVQAPIWVPNGTAGAPTYTFIDQTNMGMYRASDVTFTASLAFAPDGDKRAAVIPYGLATYNSATAWSGLSFINSTGDRRATFDLDFDDGQLGLYACTGTGWGSGGSEIFAYLPAASVLRFGKQALFPGGSASLPAVCFDTAQNDGFWSIANAQLGLSLDGTNRYIFDTVGISSPTVPFSSVNRTYCPNLATLDEALAEIASTASLHKNPHTLAGTVSEVGSTWTVNPNAPAVGTSVTATTNGRLTANADGVYRVDLSCSVSLAAGVSSIMGIRKNGSALAGSAQQTVSSIDGGLVPFSSSVLVSLNSTDYVSLYAYAPSGVGTLYNAQFLMQRIA